MKFHPYFNRLLSLFTFFVLFFTCSEVRGFGFGINKVRYHTDQHWKVLESEHFEVFYYEECETIARHAVRSAEKAFVRTSQIFEYVPKNKIPLFIYGTSQEFQETNITPQFLPEGVGGFTEVFKNRIAVPMKGSYHEFETVILHELTHAFQYNLIYGEGWRSVNLFKAVFVPNWMMEGMAEWNSQNWESQGEMVLRDALLNDQVIPLNLLNSFDHFEQVYMAYKQSQSILEYVAQLYGPEKVGLLMRKMANNQQPDSTVKYVLGISMNELYENWHFFMKSQAWARVNGMPAPEKYGETLLPGGTKAAVSPDGTRVACLTGGELHLIETSTRNKKSLLKRGFNTQGSGVAWSPDGKLLAFTASRDGEYGLYTVDVKDGKTQELIVPKMPVVYSPQWSPDQRHIVFSGFNYTTVDLYRYEVATGRVDRLTNGPESEAWASYGPDGRALYFIRESDGETSIRKLRLDQEGKPSGPSIEIGTNLGGVSSLFVGKNTLYLTSNRDRRIFNLYRMDHDGGRLTRLTNCFADLFSVAPAPDASVFYVGLYQKAQQSLYEFSAEGMERIEKPPFDLKFLSNSFDGASQILALKKKKKAPVETEAPESPEEKEKEEGKERKLPVLVPPTVTRLEVIEATNIVRIQWPHVDNEEDQVEEYKVYRSSSPGAAYTFLGSVSIAKQERYVDYSVKTGESYFYYVTAVNKIGESAPSPIVEAHPFLSLKEPKDYQLRLSPDILLFLAGYDSSFGFVGGGVFQFSDYLGNHRLGILGDTIPSVRTGVEANYEFSLWRTTVDFNFFYYENFFRIFELQTGNIVNEYRNNENGIDLNFSYPLNTTTRIEYGIGTQRFQGSPLYLRFSEGISNYFQSTSQWNVANYYRLAFVKDQRRGTRFWPSSGYGLNFTLLHAPPVFDSNVSFANLLFETQVYADLGFLNHTIWANRLIGMSSQGPNPQSFFIGNDAPFQAFFTTIRGYGGQTTFGSNLLLWNSELRYPIATNMNFVPHPLSFILIKDIELAGFVDTGIVSSHLQDLPTSPVLSSMGTGIRFYNFLYERALIMLRFDVSWRLDQALPPTFHFNLVPMF